MSADVPWDPAIAACTGGPILQSGMQAHAAGGLGTSPQMAGSPQQQQQQRQALKPGPVFVPIVLRMDDDDHELLVREWLAREAVRSL